MPYEKHFGGKGRKVIAALRKTYKSKEKADQVFYALENSLKKRKKKKMKRFS